MTGETGRRMLELRHLRQPDEDAFRLACRVMEDSDGFDFAFDFGDETVFIDYLESLENQRNGRDLPPERVPATYLVADVGSEIVGRVSIRHRLNERLLTLGGHIGYGVLPEHRGNGYATEILTQALDIARGLGLDRVLLTVDETNVASQRVIGKCGGVLEAPGPDRGIGVRRYWIALTADDPSEVRPRKSTDQ